MSKRNIVVEATEIQKKFIENEDNRNKYLNMGDFESYSYLIDGKSIIFRYTNSKDIVVNAETHD